MGALDKLLAAINKLARSEAATRRGSEPTKMEIYLSSDFYRLLRSESEPWLMHNADTTRQTIWGMSYYIFAPPLDSKKSFPEFRLLIPPED